MLQREWDSEPFSDELISSSFDGAESFNKALGSNILLKRWAAWRFNTQGSDTTTVPGPDQEEQKLSAVRERLEGRLLRHNATSQTAPKDIRVTTPGSQEPHHSTGGPGLPPRSRSRTPQ